jgi:dihydrolipoamide dehydrogenase
MARRRSLAPPGSPWRPQSNSGGSECHRRDWRGHALKPNVPIDGDRIITSREALELKETPRSIVIVGAGPIGAEFGYLYRTYGSEVTLVELLDRVLPNEDVDVSRQVERSFKAQGMTVRTKTRVEGVKPGEGGVTVTVSADGKSEDIVAERCLIGVGFGPNTEGLGLDAAGVELERGWVKVDEYARTNVPGLFAIGDVTGACFSPCGLAPGHHRGRDNRRAEPAALDYNKMPGGVLRAPCREPGPDRGASQRAATRPHRPLPIRGNGKALAIDSTEGFVAGRGRRDPRHLGYHMVGPNATEMIAEASWAPSSRPRRPNSGTPSTPTPRSRGRA